MKAQPITFFLPDTRGVELSRFGRGNRKIGMSVYTYSRIAGREYIIENIYAPGGGSINIGTCPGSSPECEAICYAKRIKGPVKDIYIENSSGDDVPELPTDAKLLRIHVSGDFSSVRYINNWITQLKRRPDVKAWAYTRSWRVAELLPALEELRALPNMQLFASMDASVEEMPPTGWRRAWIDKTWDKQLARPEGPLEHRLMYLFGESDHNTVVVPDGTPSYVCPEETGRKPDCESCRYCFDGKRNDVTFLEH